MGFTNYLTVLLAVLQTQLTESMKVAIEYIKETFPNKVVMTKEDLYEWYGRLCELMGIDKKISTKHMWGLYLLNTVKLGRNKRDCILVTLPEPGYPCAVLVGDDEEILIETRVDSYFEKTRGDIPIDFVYSVFYRVLHEMLPHHYGEFFSDEVNNDDLKKIAATVPAFVEAWKKRKAAEEAKTASVEPSRKRRRLLRR